MDRFTLRNMLAQETLGLRLMTPASDVVLDRVVMGAHGTEALHPVPWMQKDWVLLITGVRLVGSVDRQIDLVSALADGGLAALGFGIGIDFATIPEALLDAANERGFPVFEIPLKTPFREISAFVNRSLLSTDLYTMRRLTSMREFLVDSLQHEQPAATVVHRVASLLDGTAVLFSRDGSVEQSSGSQAPAQLWHCVEAAQKGENAVAVEGRSPTVAPIRDRGVVQGWLVVVGRVTPASGRFTQPLVETARIVLVSLAGLQRATKGLERAIHATFVSDLLGQQESQDSIWSHRAVALGIFGRDLPLRGILIKAAAESQPGAQADGLLATTEIILRRGDDGLSAILAVREGAVLGIVEARAEVLASRLEDFAMSDADVVIGVGREVRTVAAARSSLQDAEALVQSLRGLVARAGRIQWFEDLDLLAWALATADRSGLRSKAAAALAPLDGDEMLLRSLTVYLESKLNVVRAAAVLNVHPNTLRYRIARIEERLGRSLQEPETISLLYTAVHVVSA